MTYRIVNFTYVNTQHIQTISFTYNIYDEDGRIYRSNLRRSISLTGEDCLLDENKGKINIVECLSHVERFILNELEEI